MLAFTAFVKKKHIKSQLGMFCPYCEGQFFQRIDVPVMDCDEIIVEYYCPDCKQYWQAYYWLSDIQPPDEPEQED
jgi:hypothetical protein